MRLLVTGGSGFIGTNLIEELLVHGHELLNVDIQPPKVRGHAPYWKNMDILDAHGLLRLFGVFAPTHVVHLAARTDTDGTRLEDYETNTRGTASVLSAIRATRSIDRAIITSTQYVNQSTGGPKHDVDFAPHTVYGQSKVISEKLTRQADLECVWTITRPTNIWGPWHPRYPDEFWRILGKGFYFHPDGAQVIRAYGYVKNVVHQMLQILRIDPEKVNRRVLYLGDDPIDLLNWVNGFSMAQTGRPVRVVPRSLLRFLAGCGDALNLARIRFPITRSRYQSMTTSNGVSMAVTRETLGPSPYNLQQGISETVAWLRSVHPELVRIV